MRSPLLPDCQVINLQDCLIESVTLYQHGARVSRRIDFPLPANISNDVAAVEVQLLQAAIIEGFPGGVDSSSIRVSSSFPGVKDAWVTPAEVYRVSRFDLATSKTKIRQNPVSTDYEIAELLREFERHEDEVRLMEAHTRYASTKLKLLQQFSEAQAKRVPKNGVCNPVAHSGCQSTVSDVVRLTQQLRKHQATIQKELTDSRKKLFESVLQCSIVYQELCRVIGVPIPRPEPVIQGSLASQSAMVTTWRNRIDQFLLVSRARVILTVSLLPLVGGGNSLEPSICQSGRTIPLMISYTVVDYQTSWTPVYDIDYNSSSQLLQVSLSAELSQRTGEDWVAAQVSLALGSCPSQVTVRPPTLPVEALEFTPPAVPAKQATLSAAPTELLPRSKSIAALSGPEMTRELSQSSETMTLMTAAAPADSKMPITPSLVGCEAVGSGMTAAYKLMAPITICSGGTIHRVAITKLHGLPCQSLLWAVPSLSEQVYHQVRAKNDSNFILPASDVATVTYDGKFLSQGRMPELINPGSDFRITLGVESAVSVSYVPPRTLRREAGFVTKSQCRDFHSETHIVARDLPPHKSSVTVLLVDRIPTSGDSRISVTRLDKIAYEEMSEADFGAAAQQAVQAAENEDAVFRNAANNHIYNVVHLTKNEQKSVARSFQIEWPVDVELSFSDRS